MSDPEADTRGVETWFVVHMVDTEAKDYYTIHQTAQALSDYVRVNSTDACEFKINAVEPSTLAQNRIVEVFDC